MKITLDISRGKGKSQSDLSSSPKSLSSINPMGEKWIGQPAWNEASADNDVLMDSLINATCHKNECSPRIQGRKRYPIDYLVNNLPSITTVTNMFVQLIVGGGLTADSAVADKKLQDWLREKPLVSMTHQAIINDAIEKSVMYGYTGLRFIYQTRSAVPVHPEHFRIWKLPKLLNNQPIPGLYDEFLYEVTWRKLPIEKKMKTQVVIDGKKYTLKEIVEAEAWKTGVDGSFYFDDGEDGALSSSVFLPVKNFCHLRHTLNGDYGESILNRDRLRLGMMIDLLVNMNDEINNDGNDYIMWLKEQNIVGNSITSLLSQKSAETTAKNSVDSKVTHSAVQSRLDAANSLARKMKRSQKTRVAVVRKDIIDQFDKVAGTVRLVDYYPFLADATTIIANAFGLHPILAGSTSSGWNTSMSSVIQFTLEKIIVPYQRLYSSQLNDYLRELIGIKSNIHFKEYDITDKQTMAAIEKTISETRLNLAKEQEILNSIRLGEKPSETN